MSPLDSLLQSPTFRGAVLLSRDGQTIHRAVYGLANEEWNIPNSPTTKFRIGSVTKTFTAAAVLRLHDQGALDLRTPIDAYLDDLPRAWRKLMAHQILTHTAGLRDHLGVPAKRTLNRTGALPADLLALIAKEPLLQDPGTRRAYSNAGYVLLGALIEKLSGRSYARFLEDEFFTPLALRATGYDSATVILPERASGYILNAGVPQNADFLDMSVPYAAGGLYSTLDDLHRWNTLLHEGTVLSEDSYRRMTAIYPETKSEEGHYGYGLFISERAGQTAYWHTGGVNGFISVNKYFPQIRGSLIVLSNVFNPVGLPPIVEKLTEALLG